MNLNLKLVSCNWKSKVIKTLHNIDSKKNYNIETNNTDNIGFNMVNN